PMARLEVVKADAGAPSVIFQRLADGESLKEIAKQWAVPKGRFVEWFTTTHTDLYDAALKVRAADLALEAIDIADTPEKGVKTKTRPDGSLEVSEGDMIEHRRLQIETRKWLAEKFDRQRYGNTLKVEREVSVRIDAGLLGAAGDLLRLVASGQPRGRVLDEDTGTLTLTPAKEHELT
ncbi:MAG: hypothetical protein U0990_01130, partial [Candidatus Nanopelagicales bacterium]|nr:hypothetical protein [Candidatus Nanopelagicales bacterium]